MAGGILDRSVSLGELIEGAIGKAMRARGGSLPGYVLSYDAQKRTATVQPAIHRLIPSPVDSNEDAVEELPAVHNVPVAWPQARGFSIIGSLNKGDPVLLVALDRDASTWRATGRPSEPDDARVGSWGSCVAIPGLVPNSNPFPAPTDSVALASKIDTFLRTLSGMTDPVSPANAVTGLFAVLQAARAAVGGASTVPGTGTVGSTILKVSE